MICYTNTDITRKDQHDWKLSLIMLHRFFKGDSERSLPIDGWVGEKKKQSGRNRISPIDIQLVQWKRTHLPMQETREIWVPSLGRDDASAVGNGNLLQYSCQEYPMDRGAWSVVHGMAKSWPSLSDWATYVSQGTNFKQCLTLHVFLLMAFH